VLRIISINAAAFDEFANFLCALGVGLDDDEQA